MLLWGSIWRVHVPGRPLPLCRTQIQWPYYPRQKFNKGYSTNFPKKENSRCQEWGKLKFSKNWNFQKNKDFQENQFFLFYQPLAAWSTSGLSLTWCFVSGDICVLNNFPTSRTTPTSSTRTCFQFSKNQIFKKNQIFQKNQNFQKSQNFQKKYFYQLL